MTSFTFRMPAGIVGTVTRQVPGSFLVPEIITPSTFANAPTAFGIPVVVDTTVGNVGNMRAVIGTDTAAMIYGVLCRAFPGNNTQDPIGTSTPPAAGTCTIMRSGMISVALAGSTAAVKGGQVYIWIAASSGSHVQGGFEAASGGASTVAAPAFFEGPADANGITELQWNL